MRQISDTLSSETRGVAHATAMMASDDPVEIF